MSGNILFAIIGVAIGYIVVIPLLSFLFSPKKD